MKWLLIIPFVSASLFVQLANPDEMAQVLAKGKPAAFQVNHTYSLLNWNVYKAKKSGFFSDFAQLLEDHDLFTIQEFDLKARQRAQVEEFSHFSWVFAKSFRYASTWNGVANVAQVEPFEIIPIRSQEREPIVGTPKMALITKYPIEDGRELWLLNIHSLNFNLSHKPWRQQLDELLSHLEGYKGPALLAGDLNTWSDHRREYLLKRTEELGFSWAAMESPMGLWSRTLDYIFYRGVQAVQHEVIDEVITSDHKPLRLEFRIPLHVGV